MVQQNTISAASQGFKACSQLPPNWSFPKSDLNYKQLLKLELYNASLNGSIINRGHINLSPQTKYPNKFWTLLETNGIYLIPSFQLRWTFINMRESFKFLLISILFFTSVFGEKETQKKNSTKRSDNYLICISHISLGNMALQTLAMEYCWVMFED